MAYDPLGDLILFLSMYAHIWWLVTQYQRVMSYSQLSGGERECVCMSGNVLSKRGLKHCVGRLPSKDPVSFVPLYATMAESFGQALVTSVLCSCLLCCHFSQHLCEIYNCNKITAFWKRLGYVYNLHSLKEATETLHGYMTLWGVTWEPNHLWEVWKMANENWQVEFE